MDSRTLATSTALTRQAAAISAQLNSVAADKPADAATHSDARSFRGVATVLSAIADKLSASEAETARLTAALDRIANLRVRSADALIERGDWKRLTAELQSIAQDVLGSKPPTSGESGER